MKINRNILKLTAVFIAISVFALVGLLYANQQSEKKSIGISSQTLLASGDVAQNLEEMANIKNKIYEGRQSKTVVSNAQEQANVAESQVNETPSNESTEKGSKELALKAGKVVALSSGLINKALINIKPIKTSKYLMDAGKYYILGDDILLDKQDPAHKQLIDSLMTPESKPGAMVTKSLIKYTVPKWPNGKVPYYFTTDITTAQRAKIRTAMQNIEMACNVDFYETTPGDYRYKIEKCTNPDFAGVSTLGYIKNPAYGFSSENHGVIMHEIIHGLGFSHEHQRPDRDPFITIDWTNIKEAYKSQYEAIPAKDVETFGSYNYDSIMHYGNGLGSSFAKDPSKIIIDSKGNAIGQRDHLSEGDRTGLIKVYGKAVNMYYTANIDGAAGEDVVIKSGWGMGIQKMVGGKLSTMMFSPNGTWYGGWNFNSPDNRIRGYGDFDGKGRKDMLITSDWGMGILTKNGSSLTTTVVKPRDTWFGGWRYDATVNKGRDVIQAVGDFNGDKKDEVLVTSSWGIGILAKSGNTMTSLVAKPNGTWFGGWNFNSADNIIRGIGDFDGNGTDDIVVTSPWGIAILSQKGDTLVPLVCKPNNTWFGSWRYNASVNTGLDKTYKIDDFNGDKKAEILVTSSWGMGILAKSGDSLTSVVAKPNGTWFGGWNSNTADNTIVGSGDFDGNGSSDVVITSKWGIGILSVSGNSMNTIVCKPKDTWFGNWRYNASVNEGVDTIWSVSDISGDGKADLVLSSSWGYGVLTKSGDSMTSLDMKPYTMPWWDATH